MSISKTTPAAERWLYAVLTGDGTLAGLVGTRVYFDSIPQDAAMPLIYVTQSSGRDLAGTGPNIYATRFAYTVRAVDETPPGGLTTALVNVAARLHTVLHAASGSNVDGAVLACVREQPFTMTERDPGTGRPYRHLGGIYRMWVQ